MSFDTALATVLRHEGGYANNPADPGGATNYGVTQRTYDAWRGRQGLPTRDVRDIDSAEVRAIYLSDYWTKSGANMMAEPLATIHFDTAVNMGVAAANQLLTASGRDPARYLYLRTQRYYSIVQARPASQQFLAGWLNRVASLAQMIPGGGNTVTLVAALALLGALLARQWGKN